MNANDDDNSNEMADFDRVGTDVAAEERGNSFYSFCENNHKNWEWVQLHNRRDWWMNRGRPANELLNSGATSWLDDNESKKNCIRDNDSLDRNSTFVSI